MKSKYPKHVWAAGINLNGLWYGNPIRLTLNKEFLDLVESTQNQMHSAQSLWMDDSGDFGVNELGLSATVRGNVITFASTDKRSVELFITGAESLARIMSRFTEPAALRVD